MADGIIRIGIIGCGGIAAEHVRGYGACENAKIAAGADVDLQRAAAVAGEEHAYTSFTEMIEKEKLDAVSVCTPPKFHKDVVCKALQSGLNVLCEKPLAMNSAEAREMVDCAKTNGKLLIAAFCHRFHEPVMHARELINTGKIGKVVSFRNRFGGKADMTARWFSDPNISGGGTIPDTSIHSIDLFRFLVGDPIKVAAATASADSRYKVEDCSQIMLQTRDGAIGSIEASWTSPGSQNVIEIYGTDGAIVLTYYPHTIKYMVENSGAWEEKIYDNADRFVCQARHFVNAVSNGAQPIVDGNDGLRANEIVDAAYAFARGESGGWASLG